VAFSQNSSARIFVSDVERNSLFVFTSDGAFVREINHDSFDLPFLAGWRGDTLAVFNPPSLLTLFIFENEVIRSVTTPPDIIDDRPLLYTTVSSDHIFVKAVGRGKKGHIVTLDNHGRIKERHTLEKPYWRYAGFLRMWGDSLLSLSGFRPVIDVSYHGTSLDTLALRGFDSPMLGRSRAYMMGEVLQAPLLTPSAAPAGDLLFVLNLRTGWLRVDVFDRQGRLLHRLIEPDPVPNSNFFPQDIAVRRRDDSVYEIAVVLNEPTPRLDLYGWNPESALSRAD